MDKARTVPVSIIERVSKETESSPFFIKTVIASIVNAVIIEAEKGNTVAINPLGKFKLCSQKPRKLRNSPVSGHDTIPACKVLRFIPGRKIKKYINRTKKEE
jgi:nucleoid DNA-binding protein